MCTRLREPKTIFDVFVEVAAPIGGKAAFILWKYPEQYDNEKILQQLLKFAFPCEISSDSVQLFTFVWTDLESNYTYGYCRHTPRSNTCLCILSALPWPEVFYKYLNHVAGVMNNDSIKEVEALLINTFQQPVPAPADYLIVESRLGKNKLECFCPDHTKLPRIPDNRSLTEYYNAVNEHNMMGVFASMLHERRILFTSKRLSQLSACVMAANFLIYPMDWQHTFIPVLPQDMTAFPGMPMPYLMGVPHFAMEKVAKETDLNEVVVLDIDQKTLRTPYNDLEELPPEALSVLKRNLKASNHLMGDGIARAFLRCLVVLIGGYRGALERKDSTGRITFNEETFLASRPPSLRPYLESMLQLQIFQQFVDSRLNALNRGFGTQDEFEEECSFYSSADFNKLKYQYGERADQLRKDVEARMGNLKRTGQEAFKDFRTKLDGMTGIKTGLIPGQHSGRSRRTVEKALPTQRRAYEWHDERSDVAGRECFESSGEDSSASSLQQTQPQHQISSNAATSSLVSEMEELYNKRAQQLRRDIKSSTRNSSFDSQLRPSRSLESLNDSVSSDASSAVVGTDLPSQHNKLQPPLSSNNNATVLSHSRSHGVFTAPGMGNSTAESLLIDFGPQSSLKPVSSALLDGDLDFDPLSTRGQVTTGSSTVPKRPLVSPVFSQLEGTATQQRPLSRTTSPQAVSLPPPSAVVGNTKRSQLQVDGVNQLIHVDSLFSSNKNVGSNNKPATSGSSSPGAWVTFE